TALFASVPIVAAPVFLKTQAAAALEAAGVPMQGSAFVGGAASSAVEAGSDVARLGGDGASDAGSTASGSGAGDGLGPASGDGSVVPLEVAGRATHPWRFAALSVAAGVVLVALLFGVTGRLGGGINDEQLASSGSIPATSA